MKVEALETLDPIGFPTVKLCPGGEGVMHEWTDHAERSSVRHTKPLGFQACPDHDGLPNAQSESHLAHQPQ